MNATERTRRPAKVSTRRLQRRASSAVAVLTVTATAICMPVITPETTDGASSVVAIARADCPPDCGGNPGGGGTPSGPPGGGTEFVPPSMPAMPSYEPGRGQRPLDQYNGISIYNSTAPQPSQAAQPNQQTVQNQDGTYNRAANGEQQPINYDTAPNNQQLNNNWQKLSDQQNQEPSQDNGPRSQENQNSDDDPDQKRQCHGPYPWKPNLPLRALPQTPGVEKASELLSLPPTLVDMWEQLQQDPDVPVDIQLIHQRFLDGELVPGRGFGGYTTTADPRIDIGNGLSIRVNPVLLNDPIQLAQTVAHEMLNAQNFFVDQNGHKDTRSGEYVEARTFLLDVKLQEEIAENCGDPAIIDDVTDFAKHTKDAYDQAIKIGTQEAYEDAITSVGEEYGKTVACKASDGSNITIHEYYNGRTCA